MTIRKYIVNFLEEMFGEFSSSRAVQMDANRLFGRLNRDGILESDGTISKRTENSLITLAARATAANEPQTADRCIAVLTGKRVSPHTVTRHHAEIKLLAGFIE